MEATCRLVFLECPIFVGLACVRILFPYDLQPNRMGNEIVGAARPSATNGRVAQDKVTSGAD